ncbi:MAG: protein phosphatase 2C domain-containing protein [Planctomycetota bacterium]
MAILDRLSDLCIRILGIESSTELNGARPLANLRVRVGKFTSIGYYRENNEDRYYVDGDQRLFIVADGMGGQAAGEQASQLAVEMIPAQLRGLSVDDTDPSFIRQAVCQAVVAANEAILAQGIADPSLQNMGTTVVMAVLRASKIYIAHIGDSRAYLVRNNVIESMTTDHNLAQALYEAKTISKEELKTHKFRHVLWKYLGSKEAGDGPDLFDFDVQAGDRLVLVTDGVTGALDESAILEKVSEVTDPQKCAEDIVQLSLDRGSKDNVTCVALYIDGE